MNRVRNFCAGPCTLPVEVLAEVQDELLDFEGSGMSLIEMSHRSPEYDAVHGDALDRLRRVLEVPDEFEVLFLQGGALLQFAMVPMNLVPSGSTAGYVRSGAWGKAAHADAERAASAYLAWDGTEDGFTRMPEPRRDRGAARHPLRAPDVERDDRGHPAARAARPGRAAGGRHLLGLPDPARRLAAGRPRLWRRAEEPRTRRVSRSWSIRRSALEECVAGLPSYLGFPRHAEAGSLLNTPPMFSIYVMGKMLRWIQDRGGLAGMAERAARRSGRIYDVIEAQRRLLHRPGAAGRPLPHQRRLPAGLPRPRRPLPRRDARPGLVNLKGHRSVGGMRASIYNAMPDEGVDELAEFMRDFAGGRRMSSRTARGTSA